MQPEVIDFLGATIPRRNQLGPLFPRVVDASSVPLHMDPE